VPAYIYVCFWNKTGGAAYIDVSSPVYGGDPVTRKADFGGEWSQVQDLYIVGKIGKTICLQELPRGLHTNNH